MKPYLYETHCHTFPVSRCGKASVRETLEFYKALGYDGLFLTNHFLDGNVNYDHSAPYSEILEFYLTDYNEALRIGKEIGIKVFFGVELSDMGIDFLIYNLTPDWFRAHPEIMQMKKSEELQFMMDEGALVVQAHPYREEFYIDHISLYPRQIHAVEVYNAGNEDFQNELAKIMAEVYGLKMTAGSDNHRAGGAVMLGGISTDRPLCGPQDYREELLSGRTEYFCMENPLLKE